MLVFTLLHVFVFSLLHMLVLTLFHMLVFASCIHTFSYACSSHVDSLTGNQFVDRMKLLFMDPKLIPDEGKSKVSRRTIYKFTAIQFVCFVALLIMKFTDGAIFFPLGVLLLVPLRWLLSRYVFSQHELAVLDSEGDGASAAL